MTAAGRGVNAFRLIVRAAAVLMMAGVTACDSSSEGEAGNSEASTKSKAATPTVPSAPRAANRTNVAANPAGWPPIEFEPASLNLGLLGVDDKAEGQVKIWNVGNQPLRIVKTSVSCGCTSTDDLNGRVIPPGGFIEFTASMKGKNRTGEQNEAVRLIFDGYAQRQQYSIRAEIVLPIRVVPPYLDAQQRHQGRVQVYSLDGKPFRILAAHGRTPTLIGFDPQTDEPRNEYTLQWDISNLVSARDVPWFWVIETDRAGAEVVDMRLRHDSTRTPRDDGRVWQAKQQRLLVGDIQSGEPVEIKASIEYSANVRPNRTGAMIQSSSLAMEAVLLGVDVEDQFLHFHISITPTLDRQGLFYEELTLIASGLTETLRIIGRMP